ncbi:MAG TPA: tetratricopeptide repeat protein [Pyrinomonadaceae bacterium]|jgi:predicted Zn-dependent protease
MNRLEQDWVRGRASLAAVGGWTAEELRLVADLGFALAEQGRHQEAITVFEGLAALAPATGYFQSALGALWLRMNEPRRALEYLEAALKADAQDLAALINCGEAYLQLGEREAATRALEAGINLSDARGSAENTLWAARARALLARLQNS